MQCTRSSCMRKRSLIGASLGASQRRIDLSEESNKISFRFPPTAVDQIGRLCFRIGLPISASPCTFRVDRQSAPGLEYPKDVLYGPGNLTQ
eukprot:IDg6474t1